MADKDGVEEDQDALDALELEAKEFDKVYSSLGDMSTWVADADNTTGCRD